MCLDGTMSQIKIISRARLSKSDIKQRLQEFLQNGSCVGDIELDAIYNIAVVTMTTCKGNFSCYIIEIRCALMIISNFFVQIG